MMSFRIQKIQAIRQKLKLGVPSIGSWLQIPHTSVAEILGQSGYDWIVVDMEHGSIGVNQLPDLFRAIELGNTLPLARLAKADATHCKQALDAGAGGIVAPMIEDAEHLRFVKEASCWPPIGKRGVGYSRANLFGKNFNAYKDEAQSPLLIAQIEDINAVNNLEEILQVDGLDAIIVGPYDLSASMGITGKFEDKEFSGVMHNIIKLCAKYNVPCGDHIVQPNVKLLDERIYQGYNFIAYSTDACFIYNSCINPKH